VGNIKCKSCEVVPQTVQDYR